MDALLTKVEGIYVWILFKEIPREAAECDVFTGVLNPAVLGSFRGSIEVSSLVRVWV